MQCKCGFENAADARFCGNCRAALGNAAVSAVPNAAVPPAAAPVAAAVERVPARPLSRAHIAIGVAVVAVVAAGYWWMNRPAERYKPDNGGLYRINVDGKFGFMDRSGKTVIAPQFDLAGEFSEGLANVKVGTKSGYINTKGVVAITPQFDDAGPFRYGRAGVRLGNRFGFIDKDGKYISSPDFSWAGQFSGDLAPVRTADGVMAFVNRSGKLELAGKVESLMPFGFTAGLAPAASGGKWGFIDATGKWTIDPQFERAGNFSDGLAPVVVGGRTGYIDSKGKFVVNPQYDFGDEFFEGLAVFTSAGKMGFIDTKGRVVCDAKFLAAGHFSDGLAQVRTEDGWGFIDRAGKMVVTPQFDSASMFQNGLALVTVGGKEAYVTPAGAFVVDPFPGRSATPAHAVQEIWEGDATISEKVKQHERFILIREGTQIRGYGFPYGARPAYVTDLKGQSAQDGSFSMADEDGDSWKGRFVSAVLIKGVQAAPPESSVKEYPMRLRLVRDATANELPQPLPPTNSDWNAFLASFKEAVQRRDSGVLIGMMARNFDLQNQSFRTPAEAMARVNWDQLDKTLARGVERSRTVPGGKTVNSVVDEHPCPTCVYQVMVPFRQDADNQWRWLGIVYPGD
jgi:hypothetical protein